MLDLTPFRQRLADAEAGDSLPRIYVTAGCRRDIAALVAEVERLRREMYSALVWIGTRYRAEEILRQALAGESMEEGEK